MLEIYISLALVIMVAAAGTYYLYIKHRDTSMPRSKGALLREWKRLSTEQRDELCERVHNVLADPNPPALEGLSGNIGGSMSPSAGLVLVIGMTTVQLRYELDYRYRSYDTLEWVIRNVPRPIFDDIVEFHIRRMRNA